MKIDGVNLTGVAFTALAAVITLFAFIGTIAENAAEKAVKESALAQIGALTERNTILEKQYIDILDRLSFVEGKLPETKKLEVSLMLADDTNAISANLRTKGYMVSEPYGVIKNEYENNKKAAYFVIGLDITYDEVRPIFRAVHQQGVNIGGVVVVGASDKPFVEVLPTKPDNPKFLEQFFEWNEDLNRAILGGVYLPDEPKSFYDLLRTKDKFKNLPEKSK